ncbi:hypothetical protein [Haladaptatus caseinilyticus]|uniref:hypothetical protein n=1 Tax=Haladaptatus caseinilyticus TaxID=2993314 RepID=UPI00224A51C9|nr:hypothetical protein [Haladaptatus caseinilyticus]
MKPRLSRRNVLSTTALLLGGLQGCRAAGMRTGANQMTNHIIIYGGGSRNVIQYAFSVSGQLEKSGEAGGAPISDSHVGVNDEDTISRDGTHASGAVAGGGDAYWFTGRLVRFRVSLSAERLKEVSVFLNGQRVRLTELGDAPAVETPIEFLDCRTVRVTGDFRSVRMHTSFWDGTGLGTNWLFDGPIRGTTLISPIDEHAPYPFAIDSVSIDTRELQTPGQPAQFTADNPFAGPWCREHDMAASAKHPLETLPNHLVIVGGSPRNPIRYEFAVSGQVEKSGSGGDAPIADRHVTIDREDRISKRRVRGVVAGGADAYRFSGGIERFRIGNGARVFLNGRRIDPDDFDMQADDTKPLNDEDGPSSDIEFLACDRARVTGSFERITTSSSWYTPEGIATSYNEIGPVRGRTMIDESNVGDVDGAAGFVITDVSAYESGAARPTISKRQPNTNACDQAIRSTQQSTTETTTERTETTTEGPPSTTESSDSATESSGPTANSFDSTTERQPSETTQGRTSKPSDAVTGSPPEPSEPTVEPAADTAESGAEPVSGNESG